MSRIATKAIQEDAGLRDRATIVTTDVRDLTLEDLESVTVVVIFFVAYGLTHIYPLLLERLAPGTRIFTVLYAVPGVTAVAHHDRGTLHEYVVSS